MPSPSRAFNRGKQQSFGLDCEIGVFQPERVDVDRDQGQLKIVSSVTGSKYAKFRALREARDADERKGRLSYVDNYSHIGFVTLCLNSSHCSLRPKLASDTSTGKI